MTFFSFLFRPLAVAVWRAGRCLDTATNHHLIPAMPGQLTSSMSVAIVVALVDALQSTRTALAESRAKLEPTEAELAAYKAEDAEVEAALLSAQQALGTSEPDPDPEPDPEPLDPNDPEPDPVPDPVSDPDPSEPDPV